MKMIITDPTPATGYLNALFTIDHNHLRCTRII
ncbi:hypothetical protein JOJ88_005019 [Pantoea cypripedii]|nr:hypothetical protein [Pantoea cypripedii]